jgi:phosphate uptake regulator
MCAGLPANQFIVFEVVNRSDQPILNSIFGASASDAPISTTIGKNSLSNIIRGDNVRDEKANTLTDKFSKKNLSLIALQAPVATDLRTLGAYLKIVTDLERIGDHATNIGEWTVYMTTGNIADLNH